MCKVYNTIGSLSAIKSHLRHYNITDFQSVRELITFQNNYGVLRQRIIREHEVYIKQEKGALDSEILELNDSIATRKAEIEENLVLELGNLKQQLEEISGRKNVIQKLITFFKKRSLQRKIQAAEANTSIYVSQSVQYLVDSFAEKNHRRDYIISRFSDAVEESASVQLAELKKKESDR